MSEKQLAVKIEEISEANAPALYVAGGLQQFIDLVKGEVEGEVPDLKTRKGRERIASLAAKVSKSKTAVEKPGRDYLRRLKEMPKVVEAELRDFVTKMDALRDETRRPLTEWEAAEDARIDRHNDRLNWLKTLADDMGELSSLHIKGLIAEAQGMQLGAHWEEFEAEAANAKDKVLNTLRAALQKREQVEAEQAELERLRREADERAEADRIRLAQEQAVEAERQRMAQEQQAERDAAARREQELIVQAAAQQRAIEQAEANRIAAEQRAAQERQDAARRAEEAAERARQDERRRADAAAAEIVRQQEARERDKNHRASINRAALEAFVAEGMTEECAKQAIKLIALRKIPNIAISY
ncbi:chemotaxis protein histidine kinase CheA [Pseudomonas fulva]